MAGCKIAVYTGLIKKLGDDAKLATVRSHEVAHAIARHAVENCTRSFLELGILRLYEYSLRGMVPRPVEFLIQTLHKYCLRLPRSRRMEIEADRIGLLLLAAAGYDPSDAPSVWKKLGGNAGDWKLSNYVSNHPSFKKRAQFVLQANVMEEALKLYNESAS